MDFKGYRVRLGVHSGVQQNFDKGLRLERGNGRLGNLDANRPIYLDIDRIM